VVASPHTALRQDPATATERLLAAIRNPFVHIIGHPTGRIVLGRDGLSPDIRAIAAAAAEHGVALEINAHWMRLDLRDSHVRAAIEAGAMIAIDCDIHAVEDADNLRYGVMTARRAGLTPDRCVNCMSRAELDAWLVRRRTGRH
jgi:DNA polymerase (family 10)